MAGTKDFKRNNKKKEEMADKTENKKLKSDNKKSANSAKSAKHEKTGQKDSAKKKDTEKTEDSKTDNIEQQEATLEEKLAEAQDKYIRLSAEFDNYRKRTLKEKMDLTKSAGETIISNILPVMDDFDRALQVMEEASDCKAMKEGIDLIYAKFNEFLKANGVKEIEAKEKTFDTDLHEAVTKIPAPDKKLKGKIVDVIQKGYYLNEKVIRYAKVVVGE